MKLTTLVLVVLVSVVGCGDDTGGAQGFTECGSATCQPGQYCRDSDFNSCDNGCLSDVNCAANQVCDTINANLAGVSQCINGAVPVPDASVADDATVTPDATSTVGRCDAALNVLLACDAIDNVEFSDFKTACDTNMIPEVQIMGFNTCVSAGADCEAKALCI